MQNSKISPGAIPWTPVLGEKKVCFVLQKCTKTILQQCRIPKFSRGQYPRPSFQRPEILFSCSENSLKLSNTAMQNSQILREQYHRTLVLGERKVCFRYSEMYKHSSTAMPNSIKKIREWNPWTQVFGNWGESCLLLKLCLATPLSLPI